MDFARYATHLELFVEVTRLGSFAATARRRGVATSSIVRRIDALEDDLQTRLFARSTRALALTDAGERLLVRAQDVINRLIDARSEIGALDETPSGLLRVSCLPTFGRLHVLPVIADLLDAWPQLAIELDLTERLTDPANGRCDAAIRIGAQPDSGLIATRIGAQRWIICASPDYLARQGRPMEIRDIVGHRRIGKARELPGLGWSRLPIENTDDSMRIFRCDEFEAQRIAACGGMGLAMLPNWVVGHDVAEGRLVRLFNETGDTAEPIQILRALPDTPPKLGVFIEAMRRHFVLE